MSYLKINIGHSDLYLMVQFFAYISRPSDVCTTFVGVVKVKRMQRSGTEAIRTQIQPLKTKREITNITNSQNTREHMVNRVSSYFPKDGHVTMHMIAKEAQVTVTYI